MKHVLRILDFGPSEINETWVIPPRTVNSLAWQKVCN